jgi:hypothetical protein
VDAKSRQNATVDLPSHHLAARPATTQQTDSLKQNHSSMTVHIAPSMSTRADLAAQRVQSVRRVPVRHDPV